MAARGALVALMLVLMTCAAAPAAARRRALPDDKRSRRDYRCRATQGASGPKLKVRCASTPHRPFSPHRVDRDPEAPGYGSIDSAMATGLLARCRRQT